MFDLFETLNFHTISRVKIIDVGAMSTGAEDAFTPLVKSGRAQIIGFEPNRDECNRLNTIHGPPHVFLPHAIGDGSIKTFHVCNAGVTSSTYEPNAPLLSLFQGLESITRVVSRHEVQTRRLDDIEEVRGADYLKLDVQGAELDVLRGAADLLQSVLVVQTEVEFVPIYIGQPLFGDIDQALRKAGFLFHRTVSVSGRTFAPLMTGNDPNGPGSQILWGDAIYVRNFMELDSLSSEQLVKLAFILHAAIGSYDMVQFVLRTLDARQNTSFARVYINRLTSGPVDLRW